MNRERYDLVIKYPNGDILTAIVTKAFLMILQMKALKGCSVKYAKRDPVLDASSTKGVNRQ